MIKDIRKITIILTILIEIALVGCGKRQVRIEIRHLNSLPSVGTRELVAGVAVADITPAPNMPLAGYSMNANVGTGFRTRLYARVIYLRSKDESPVAIVQCDLLSGSLLLHHRVLELIAPETDIDSAGLMIVGTHTHSGPGNYFESNFYNRYASCKNGFDQNFFDFLSGRIAGAVIKAYKTQRPARIATGKTEIWNMTRNRSIKAYRANKNEKDAEVYRAVNPYLHMVRIDCADINGRYRPAGAFSSFSIHGTVVPSSNDFYNGDVFAYIEREFEWSVKKRYNADWDIVYAIANGTHADNSPNYSPGMQGFSEAGRIGREIGRKAFELFVSLENKLAADNIIRSAAREIDVYKDRAINGITLCDRPVVGTTLTAGAEDGPTPVLQSLPPFKEGSRRWFFTGGCQGHKRYLLGPVQYLILPKEDFPHYMYLQVVRINSLMLFALPFEVTMEAGRRVALSGMSKQDKRVTDYAVLSCANGYFGYVTTPEEYSAQHYEGGHTLYGPNTEPFIQEHIKEIGAMLADKKSNGITPDKWIFYLKSSRFYPGKLTPAGERKVFRQPEYVYKQKDNEPYLEFSWYDVPPSEIDFHEPLIYVDVSIDKTGWKRLIDEKGVIDDSGCDISIKFMDKISGKNMGLYEARWYNPLLLKGFYYRFAVAARGAYQTYYSEPFSLAGEKVP